MFDWTDETRAGMFARLDQVAASASSAQRDRASGQVSLFDSMDFGQPAVETRGLGETVPEWSKDERLAHEKELLGFYVTGHPLDKFRGVIDAERYNKIGVADSLDMSNPRERFAFAGTTSSGRAEGKTTKSGKPFGVITIEDFTGSAEVLLWGESFVPARDSGLLVPGAVIRLRAAVQAADDRTQARKLTGYEVSELKPRKVAANGNGPVELTLWTGRHSERDLEDIRMVLAAHPGTTPVWLHFNSSAGRCATVEAGQAFRVKRDEALSGRLPNGWKTDSDVSARGCPAPITGPEICGTHRGAGPGNPPHAAPRRAMRPQSRNALSPRQFGGGRGCHPRMDNLPVVLVRLRKPAFDQAFRFRQEAHVRFIEIGFVRRVVNGIGKTADFIHQTDIQRLETGINPGRAASDSISPLRRLPLAVRHMLLAEVFHTPRSSTCGRSPLPAAKRGG